MKVKKLISELKPGMFVFELDRPWLDTPYPIQGFLIQSEEDIATLREYCEFVYIDPLKEQVNPSTGRMRFAPLLSASSSKDRTIPIGTVKYADQHNVEKEIPRAKVVYQAASEVVERMRTKIEKQQVLDVKAATVLVDGLVDSIVANPDALLLLQRLKREAQSIYDQAVSVSVHMLVFGCHVGLPRDELSILGLAGLLLDVGMMQLPKELLQKETLTPAEHAIIKRHVGYSEELLRRAHDTPVRVVEIVCEHHEREDGSGYPRGLLGNEISVYGKMASIVDCYRELTLGRTPNMSLPPYRALELMHGWAGRFFHPTLIEQFIQCIGVYPVGSLVELSTGEVAVVIAHSRVRRLRPRIMIILDPKKKQYTDPKMVELIHEPLS
ncbi:MAG: HD-GYP domain-containing protein, partial [Burkholderiales bacterium]